MDESHSRRTPRIKGMVCHLWHGTKGTWTQISNMVPVLSGLQGLSYQDMRKVPLGSKQDDDTNGWNNHEDSKIMLCRRCHHFHVGADNDPMNVCKDLHCNCSTFEAATEERPVIPDYQKYLLQIEGTAGKVRYILENIPELRDSSNKEFVFNYWFLCDGLRDDLTNEILDNLTDPEIIRRAKQKEVEKNFAKYGPTKQEVIEEKGLKYWAVYDYVVSNK